MKQYNLDILKDSFFELLDKFAGMPENREDNGKPMQWGRLGKIIGMHGSHISNIKAGSRGLTAHYILKAIKAQTFKFDELGFKPKGGKFKKKEDEFIELAREREIQPTIEYAKKLEKLGINTKETLEKLYLKKIRESG